MKDRIRIMRRPEMEIRGGLYSRQMNPFTSSMYKPKRLFGRPKISYLALTRSFFGGDCDSRQCGEQREAVMLLVPRAWLARACRTPGRRWAGRGRCYPAAVVRSREDTAAGGSVSGTAPGAADKLPVLSASDIGFAVGATGGNIVDAAKLQ